MDIVWENPSPRTRNSAVRAEEEKVAHALRENPFQWARIKTKTDVNQAGSYASLIKSGKRAAFRLPPNVGKFETTTRTVDGKGVVYARFVPVD